MKYLFYIICFFAITESCLAQTIKPEIISTTGDYFKNTTNSLSWTLGECITETFSTSGYKFTQGFQQSTYIVTSANEPTIPSVSIKVYPNPTSDKINISMRNERQGKLEYLIELYDLLGRKQYTGRFTNNLIELNMLSYPAGAYLLKISNGNQALQNFKIQKIN
jgi:hypothetical protein